MRSRCHLDEAIRGAFAGSLYLPPSREYRTRAVALAATFSSGAVCCSRFRRWPVRHVGLLARRSGLTSTSRAREVDVLFPAIVDESSAWPGSSNASAGYTWRAIPRRDSGLGGVRFYDAAVAPDTAHRLPRFQSLRDIAKALDRRACGGRGHPMFACNDTISGDLVARGTALRMVIRDAATIAALRRARPDTFELVVFREMETLTRVRVPVTYASAPGAR